MTIYERIQNAIEFIESNLNENLRCEEIAWDCNMSERSFHNYFFCITGFSFKQYLIKRRLSRSLELLSDEKLQVVEIAFESGYQTHESFTRAFRKEFGVAPVDIRNDPRIKMNLRTTEKLQLIKEMYMGVIVKKLPMMKALSFSAMAPDSEDKSIAKMYEWMHSKGLESLPHRVFGHNIDRNGKLSNDPQNEGYKVLLCFENQADIDCEGATVETIEAGTFVVTGIEGTFENDPSGQWIIAGWQKLSDMINAKNYQLKQPARWFEEHLEASKPGCMRMDLYLEIN
ncbi:MAG TPA: AraC family transcriptional regulator [Chitinispirillaceae bacterium]|nr:AraC family transcriptional regulator [Chitinispirillaceae bacterium]